MSNIVVISPTFGRVEALKKILGNVSTDDILVFLGHYYNPSLEIWDMISKFPKKILIESRFEHFLRAMVELKTSNPFETWFNLYGFKRNYLNEGEKECIELAKTFPDILDITVPYWEDSNEFLYINDPSYTSFGKAGAPSHKMDYRNNMVGGNYMTKNMFYQRIFCSMALDKTGYAKRGNYYHLGSPGFITACDALTGLTISQH